MAQRRGKNQARRSGGGGGLPGWAWLVIGMALTLVVVVAAPRLMKPGEDGFWRNTPRPNPDAQPQPADEEAVVDEEAMAAGIPAAKPADGRKSSDFDFYTLLPGKEVPVSDAELAASEKAEQAREQAATDAANAAQATPSPTGAAAAPEAPLPQPVDATSPSAAPVTAAVTPPASNETVDSTRYILQAGAFQASGQAEELKAKIALLGLGARVESAQIGGKTVYRVRMGPYGSASELAEAKRKLASGGLDAMAIKTN